MGGTFHAALERLAAPLLAQAGQAQARERRRELDSTTFVLREAFLDLLMLQSVTASTYLAFGDVQKLTIG